MTKNARKDDDVKFLTIPHSRLSPEALEGLVEAFVLREGTEYGQRPYTLGQKVRHVVSQLERGEAVIVCEPRTNSVDIVLHREISLKRD
ncbi:MAG TPA: hypothetical protein DGR97_12495 [Gammaproteobacteria bacterium]|nr:hypothetical protein [Gammaproteobacteria bacterium]